MIQEIAFTVYAVTDMKKARAFYEGVLGLIPSPEYDGTKSANWIEYNIGTGTFAIGSSPDWKTSQDGASVAFEVSDFDDFVKKLKDKGVPFKMEAQNFPTCSMAVVRDPDMNNILIHKRKAK